MPSLRDQFAHFYMPDEDAIESAMKTGLVAPDTNVVLDLYRFQALGLVRRLFAEPLDANESHGGR